MQHEFQPPSNDDTKSVSEIGNQLEELVFVDSYIQTLVLQLRECVQHRDDKDVPPSVYRYTIDIIGQDIANHERKSRLLLERINNDGKPLSLPKKIGRFIGRNK